MATRIVLNNLAGNREVEVAETFGEVLDKCWPTIAPNSSIQARKLCTFTLPSGDKVFIQTMNVVLVEENA